jgi:hypothetical protein
MDPKYSNIPAQQQFMTSIILHPLGHAPRRFTALDNLQHHYRASISPNKFDIIKEVGNRNSTKLTGNDIQLLTNFIGKGAHRNSTLSNKFDIIDPSLVNNLEGLGSRRKTFTTNNPKVAHKKYSMVSQRGSQFFKIPLNKEYQINIERNIENTDINYKDSKISVLILDNIEFVYDIKGLTNVYHHMNFLKRFELPEEFKNNFIKEIMRETKKPNLEGTKLKDIVPRGRSGTVVVENTKRCI